MTCPSCHPGAVNGQQNQTSQGDDWLGGGGVVLSIVPTPHTEALPSICSFHKYLLNGPHFPPSLFQPCWPQEAPPHQAPPNLPGGLALLFTHLRGCLPQVSVPGPARRFLALPPPLTFTLLPFLALGWPEGTLQTAICSVCCLFLPEGELPRQGVCPACSLLSPVPRTCGGPQQSLSGH